MVRYLLRRVLWALVLCIVVTLVTYVLFFLVPNDLPAALAGQGSNQDQRARAIHYLGLDRPVYVQYGEFVWRLVEPERVRVGGHTVFARPRGDLGRSFLRAEPVDSFIARTAPVTAVLVVGGALLWMLIALPVGILCALRPGSVFDRSSMTLALIGISVHPLWMGLIFSLVFGDRLGWFPIQGYCDLSDPPPNCNGAIDWAYHMFLPWLTFALTGAAYYVRIIRANVLDVLPEDYVRTARAKGAPEQRVLRAHVLRNALLPVVTMLGIDLGLAFGGVIFNRDGLQPSGTRAPHGSRAPRERPADHHGRRALRELRGDRGEPRHRPALCADRPTHPRGVKNQGRAWPSKPVRLSLPA